MTLMRVQAVHHAASGITADDMVNTFYFQSEIATVPNTNTIDQDDADAVGLCIENFFKQDVPSTIYSVNFFRAMFLLHPTLQLTVKVYDMADASPRQPRGVYDAPDMAGSASTLPLPAEVAACLSYKGPNALLPPARRRGRIYIGPLNSNAIQIESDGVNAGRPMAALNSTLRSAGQRLKDDCVAQGWRWVVYSPTASGAGAPVVTRITELSTDDAFDTQRRRGPAATRRDVITV